MAARKRVDAAWNIPVCLLLPANNRDHKPASARARHYGGRVFYARTLKKTCKKIMQMYKFYTELKLQCIKNIRFTAFPRNAKQATKLNILISNKKLCIGTGIALLQANVARTTNPYTEI